MLDARAREPGVDYWAVRVLKDTRAAPGVQAVRRGRVAAPARAAAGTAGVHRVPGVVARRLRDVPRALHVADGRDWRLWPEDLSRTRRPRWRTRVASTPSRCCIAHYQQWVAHTQWAAARRARTASACSATSRSWWPPTAPMRGRNRTCSCSMGRSARRQTRSAKTARTGSCRPIAGRRSASARYDWFQHRARRMADLFDGFRVDHVVGLFRTWVFPLDGRPSYFTPADEPSQSSSRAARSSRRFRGPARGWWPKISAPFRTSCAASWRRSASPAARCCAGSGTGSKPADRSSTRRLPRPSRLPRRARTTPRRWPSGGAKRTTETARVLAMPSVASLVRDGASRPSRRSSRRA